MNFRDLRKGKRITQAKLANKLGVDQTTISKWEVRAAIPSVKKMVEISLVLDVPLEAVIQCFTTETKNSLIGG